MCRSVTVERRVLVVLLEVKVPELQIDLTNLVPCPELQFFQRASTRKQKTLCESSLSNLRSLPESANDIILLFVTYV